MRGGVGGGVGCMRGCGMYGRVRRRKGWQQQHRLVWVKWS